MKKTKLTYIIVIIISIIVIATVIGIGIIKSPKREELPKIGNLHYKIVEEKEGIETTDSLERIIPWNQQKITEQYSIVKYNNITYLNNSDTEIQQELIGRKIGNVILNGYDSIENIQYSKNAEIYEIKDLLKDAIIAVKFDGQNNYFSYFNIQYNPATLKDYINALKLRENLSFNSINYNMYLETKDVLFEFKNVSEKEIWNRLFNNENVKITLGNKTNGKDLMYLKCKVAFSKSDEIRMWITDEGYARINVLRNYISFYIGKEKVEEFMNYVFDNYEAEATIYKLMDINSDDYKIEMMINGT